MSQTNLSRPFLLLGLTLFLLVVNIRPASLQAEVAPGRVLNWQSVPHLPTTDSPPTTSQPIAPDILVPGSQIVFQSFRDLEDWDLYRMNSDSSGETAILSNNEYEFQPRFKPGLGRIAYTGEGEFNYEIFTMNPIGTEIVRLTDNEDDDVNPAWSPDGSKIAYQSYQDGQAEIYVMNADGSGKTRLTFDSSYDGMPAWSPDGSKIAFSSGRNGVYRIYTINPDGNGLTQLSTQSLSFAPTWSHDGNKLAFSADADGDGWLEAWTMNSDGSNPQVIVNPGGAADALTRSWSPDSNYVAYTHVSYTYYQGSWYWTSAYLRAYDTITYALIPISNDNTAWEPDWQTSDIATPVSAITPLSSLVPALFTLSWSGSDFGGSGISSYDIQMKVGNGNWTDLLTQTTATSVQVSGTSGQVLSFRSRARDYASHLEEWPAAPDTTTTIDNLPPITSIQSLPAYSRSDQFNLSWYGNDPGGSNMVYDVQYRLTGVWEELLTGISSTSIAFGGTPGDTYYFRVRGRDDAQNVEAWPAGNDGDSSTTLYRWQIYGTAYNNTGAPVSGTQATITPGGFATVANDPAGQYAAYSTSDAQTHIVTWQKNNYQTLPETQFELNTIFLFDWQQDVWLPPADNLIQNWGWESGNLNDGWNVSGTIPAEVITQTYHTGQYGLQLGNLYEPTQELYPATPYLLMDEAQIDDNGTIHIILSRHGTTNQLFYARKPANGSWSTTELIHQENSWSAHLLIDSTNTPHVVWVTSEQAIRYSHRNENGTWTSPISVYTSQSGSRFQAGMGSNNVLHLVWEDDNVVRYGQRSANGVWSQLLTLGEITNGWPDSLGLDVTEQGNAHVIWQKHIDLGGWVWRQVQYRQQDINGNWSPIQILNPEAYGSGDQPHVTVDSMGVVHAIWLNNGENSIYYTHSTTNGWSAPIIIVSQPHIDPFMPITMLADDSNSLHISWLLSSKLYYIRREAVGLWSDVMAVVQDPFATTNSYIPAISKNFNGEVEILGIVTSNAGLFHDFSLLTEVSNGVWARPYKLTPPSASFFEMLTDNNHKTHIIWSRNSLYSNDDHVYYTARDFAETSGEVAVSQMVTIPVTMTQATLSFLYQLVGASSADTRFEVTVDDGSGVTTLFSTSQNSSDWEHNWVSLADWAGETVTISLMLHQTAGRPVPQLYIDEVTLGSGHPDVWAGVNTRPGLPNQQTQLTLTYGNQGGYPAGNSQLTLTLPPGLSFTSATTPPTAINGQTITWDLGSLPAGSGPATIIVTAHVASATPFFTNLTSQLTINTASTELETANNTATGHTFIAYLSYLPTIAWP